MTVTWHGNSACERWRAAVLLLALLMGVSPRPALAQSPGDGAREGIQVHGRWTIDVREPDGTLVEHREFENELTAQGAARLAAVMGRREAPGHWAIALEAVGGVFSPCLVGSCIIVPAGASSSAGLSQTLGVSGTDSVVLEGQFTATRNGAINRVRTLLQTCPASTAFGSCAVPLSPLTAFGFNAILYIGLRTGPGPLDVVPTFTGTSIAEVSVQSGQIVQISVTLSFS